LVGVSGAFKEFLFREVRPDELSYGIKIWWYVLYGDGWFVVKVSGIKKP